MSHQTFKVCILIDNLVENFYIKHYIDEYQPVFNRFKNQVFSRNPSVNTPTTKIYWIDSENDEILVACEEDFRLYLEQGQGRKIYFCVKNKQQQQQDEGVAEEAIAMEAEEIQQKCERRSRKARDEEKQRRHARKLAEKLKHLEEKCMKDDDKGRRCSEKREYKHAERMEKAKRRVEQIRSIIGSIDPANLNSNANAEINVGASTSTSAGSSGAAAESSANSANIHPSPETIRLLSGAIAGCLQPCNLINKILNEVIGMIPQMVDGQTQLPPPYSAEDTNQQQQEQQETSKLLNSQATNTSDANTPVAVRQASHEIEALFKEAAKELEKMNEIVNSSKSVMEISQSSSTTGITQVERTFANINDSAISNATIVNAANYELEDYQEEEDQADGQAPKGTSIVMSLMDDELKSATPLKSMRSRESSIEVHDVNSMMSDDSRDWTILDQEEMSIEPAATSNIIITPRIEDPSTGAIPKKVSVDNGSQVDNEMVPATVAVESRQDSVTIETQTPTSLLNEMTNQELQASVQKSIEIVQKSIQTIQKTMENSKDKPVPVIAASSSSQPPSAVEATPAAQKPAQVIPKPNAPPYGFLINQIEQMKQAQEQSAARAPPQTLENFLKTQENKPIATKFEPAVVVYDPNPKINAAVHTMMNMGFSNEDNWLTQLLINVDGDIPKALNFLTPQPKPANKKN